MSGKNINFDNKKSTNIVSKKTTNYLIYMI